MKKMTIFYHHNYFFVICDETLIPYLFIIVNTIIDHIATLSHCHCHCHIVIVIVTLSLSHCYIVTLSLEFENADNVHVQY